MRKVVTVGEFAQDLVFDASGAPAGSAYGGRITLCAAMLARQGLPVKMVSEVSSDRVGEAVTAPLAEAGVDMSCVDRFNEGVTPTQLYYPRSGGGYDVIRYEQYPEECFDVAWPRVDPGDILVFGGYQAIDPRARQRMLALLSNASERGLLLVYLPGFLPSRAPRITRVMPAILENLELASVVVTRSADLEAIFGTADDAAAWNNHIKFYADNLVNVDAGGGRIRLYSTSVIECRDVCPESRSVLWNAGALSGLVGYIYSNLPAPGRFSSDAARACLAEAVAAGDSAVAKATADWQLFY